MVGCACVQLPYVSQHTIEFHFLSSRDWICQMENGFCRKDATVITELCLLHIQTRVFFLSQPLRVLHIHIVKLHKFSFKPWERWQHFEHNNKSCVLKEEKRPYQTKYILMCTLKIFWWQILFVPMNWPFSEIISPQID